MLFTAHTLNARDVQYEPIILSRTLSLPTRQEHLPVHPSFTSGTLQFCFAYVFIIIRDGSTYYLSRSSTRIRPPMDHSESTAAASCDYSTLPSSDHDPKKSSARLWPLAQVAAMLVLVLVAALLFGPRPRPRSESGRPPVPRPENEGVSRGAKEGVSEKSTGSLIGSGDAYNWTNSVLHWQRTAFHFQPQKNWMNDPDAPLWYKGWYHLFYQWNPDSAVWGNITWGHAVSRDLVHWLLLPPAMVPDHWYDANGVWSGSATLLPPDGRVVVLYTGSTNASVQVQNLAAPADPSDPLLVRWLKSTSNPLLLPPPGVGPKDFRDPTTAWSARNRSSWRVGIGSKDDSQHAGIALVYQTEDFLTYRLLPGRLHEVPGTGMWECLDFYPVSAVADVGLDTSAEPKPGAVKHVLKASLDDDKHDYYAIGGYDPEGNVWLPDDPENDVGVGLRLDYGKYYASKTFYDETKQRRVLWGWSGETDSENADLLKGWASVQTIPRTILYDRKTGSNLLQWPIEEVESLRLSSKEFIDTELATGSIVPLDVGRSTQLDMEAEFVIETAALARTVEADVGYNCSTSGGAYGRGALGPFGLLVLAGQDLSEQTAVYFYVSRGMDGSLRTFVCSDELRSSKANDLVKRVHGSTVPVLDGETLTLRVLVDHSIVESFAQGGRTCITSRVYPTEAIYSSARVFLFNNATGARVTVKSIKVWHMDSAFIRPYEAQGN